MQKAVYLWVLISLAVIGCGGGGEDTPQIPIPSVDAPTLTAIGNKTVTVGDTVSFTVSATDPNSLPFVLTTDGNAGSGANPYTQTGSLATFSSNSGQFNWDTTGVVLGSYQVSFTVTNSASYTDSETITITIQGVPNQFSQGQTLYNMNCNNNGCHKDEDTNTSNGSDFTILCNVELAIKNATEGNPPINMPTFTLNTAEEAAIAFYLQNVRPGDC